MKPLTPTRPASRRRIRRNAMRVAGLKGPKSSMWGRQGWRKRTRPVHEGRVTK